MKIVLVLTDSSTDCRKALETLSRFGDMLSADVEILVVLEDIYRLETASLSLGFPLPPDTVKSAKERVRTKVENLWRRVKEDEEAKVSIKTSAGYLREEVLKFVREEKPDMIIWGCQPTSELCRIIDDLAVTSLIIK